MACIPLGFILSVVGVISDQNKLPAVLAAVASGGLLLLFFGSCVLC